MRLVRRLMAHEALRFLMSGGTLFVLDFTIFSVCHFYFGLEVWLSELIGRGTGATTGFFLHKLFTFANPKGQSAVSTQKQGVGYTATALFNLAFSPFLVSWLAWLMDPYVALAKALGTILLAFETFVIFRFLFRASQDETLPESKPS